MRVAEKTPHAEANTPRNEVLLSVRDLSIRFDTAPMSPGGQRYVQAVDGVSFDIRRGRTFGLVGQSGCGKTTLARAIMRVGPASAGRVLFDGVDLLSLESAEMHQMRRRIQMIFQDPGASLNPRMRIGRIVADPLLAFGMARGSELRDRVAALLERVGLRSDDANRWPHELSGGQRQRVGIARAIALEPELIVCDEPVSALDVSVQAQVLNLLADVQQEMGTSYLFISHDLAVVEQISHDVGVMHDGRLVETGAAEAVLARPAHPYTKALRAAVPTGRRHDRAG